MSDEKTLGQVLYEAQWPKSNYGAVDKTSYIREAAGIAAVADVVARRVFAEGMTAYLAEQDKPAEPPKPEAASEAGDWVMGAANWVVTLYETTGIVTSSEIASRIREAAERHYANVMANDRRGLVETLNSTASALDMAIQDRDAARAECERLQSECTARSASLGMAISVANALADERDNEANKSIQANNAELVKERDAAVAEWEQLRKYVDELLKLGASKPAAPPSPAAAATGMDELMAACETVSNRIHNAGCWSVAFVGEVVRAHIRPLFDAVLAERDKLKSNIAAGVAEMRRYVEGNGFEWQPALSSVDNVTTAIGWLGGALQTMKAERDKLAAELREVRECVTWAATQPIAITLDTFDATFEVRIMGVTKATGDDLLECILAAYRSTKGKEQADGPK